MTVQKLKIWSNNYFSDSQQQEKNFLRESLTAHDFRLFGAKETGTTGAARDFLLQADIAFGQPDADALLMAKNLRWAQIGSAGYTAYDREDLKENLRNRGVILTNSSTVFDEACAQHLLAMILSFARALPLALDEQRGEKSWLIYELRSKIRLLNDQTALILGFGTIGKRLAELLAPLKMNLIGVKRKIRGDESVKIIETSRVEEFLPVADHVINILPDNDSTKNFLSRERFARVKPGAIIYNIGRGTTLDQNALLENLKTGRLGGAYLDVTEPEPLPPNDPLWNAPNCYITPHVAGGYAGEKYAQVKHFIDNLRRFEQGEELINRIL